MPTLDVRAAFPGADGYLNTASLGLPPPGAVSALHHAIDAWAAGATSPPDYDDVVRRARESFARLTAVPTEWVAVAGQVSSLVGLVAASLPPGAEVLGYEGEFTSVIFPFLARPDLQVRLVPLADVAAEIRDTTRLVAVSMVQSSDGSMIDLPAVRAAGRVHGARVLLDGTQSVGWLPYDAQDADVHIVGAYKWLLSPRGTSFASIVPDLRESLPTVHAGWYAGEDPWQSIYGPPLRLAGSARRFDLSPAWLSWVGTAAALEYLEAVGLERIHRHDIDLAGLARKALDLPSVPSAIASMPLPRGAGERLARAGIRYAVRDGRARFSFHLYNSGGRCRQARGLLESPLSCGVGIDGSGGARMHIAVGQTIARSSRRWWPDAFCERLASCGFGVVRFDNRDTGLSTHFPSSARQNPFRALLGQTRPSYRSLDMLVEWPRTCTGFASYAADSAGRLLLLVVARSRWCGESMSRMCAARSRRRSRNTHQT